MSQLFDFLNSLRPDIISAAQDIYNEWDDAGMGICDEISMAIGTILSVNSIDNTEGGHEGDDHSYVIAYDDLESYAVDIPYSTYEIGGGYNWQKIPDVIFTEDDVVIVAVPRPDWIDNE